MELPRTCLNKIKHCEYENYSPKLQGKLFNRRNEYVIPISEYDYAFVIPECFYRESIELVKVDSR